MQALLLNSLPALALLLPGGPQPTESPSASVPIEFTRSAPRYVRDYGHRTRVQLEIFTQDIDQGEVDFEPDLGPDYTRKDVNRKRVGFRAAFGQPAVRGYVNFFGEEWERGFTTPDNFDLFGFGGGVLGEPVAASFENDNIRIVIPYRAGFNLVLGDDEDGADDEDTAYVELEAEVGVGVHLWGFRPMIGFYSTSLSGVIDNEMGATDTSTDYNGSNVGGFIELRYKHDKFPLYASLRALGGDVEGGMFTFGASRLSRGPLRIRACLAQANNRSRFGLKSGKNSLGALKSR